MKYVFYFDESFHTRNITEASLSENDYFNSYISTGIAIKSEKKSNVFKKYKTIEKKYKKFYCVEELKSEVISKKHYKYGLKNFNDKEIELYSDIFGFLLDNDIQYYIYSCDKLEYLLLQCNYKAPFYLNKFACIYSITKLVNVYRPKKVIEDIMNGEKSFIFDLKEFMKKQLSINGSLKLKEKENDAINNILLYLNNIDSSQINYEFNYRFTYYGLKKLIKKLNIRDVSIIIDKEGIGKNCMCARMEGFEKARQIDSKYSPGIRISDMFCGFIARMMRAIYNDTKNDPNIIYDTKHLLDKKWFDINEKQFVLYKLVAKYFKKYINVYYGSYIGLYFDLFDEFMGLIYYFDDFKDFDKYTKKSIEDHAIDCNNIIILRILNDLKRLEYLEGEL